MSRHQPQTLLQQLMQTQGAQFPLQPGYAPQPTREPASSDPQTRDARQSAVVTPMGSLYDHVLSEIFVPFDRVFRARSDDSFYDPDRSPSNTFQFSIGAVRVPENNVLLIMDYSFDAAKVCGANASDTIPLEQERMSTLFGFDINVNGIRQRDCAYEIDPVPIQATRAQFEYTGTTGGRTPTPSYFNRVQGASFAPGGGAANALMPNMPRMFGPTDAPFTIAVPPNGYIAGECVIFRPIPVPLAYVEFSVSGYFVTKTIWERFIQQIQP